MLPGTTAVFAMASHFPVCPLHFCSCALSGPGGCATALSAPPSMSGGQTGPQKVTCGPAFLLQPRLPSRGLHPLLRMGQACEAGVPLMPKAAKLLDPHRALAPHLLRGFSGELPTIGRHHVPLFHTFH